MTLPRASCVDSRHIGLRTPMLRKSQRRHIKQENQYKDRSNKIANKLVLYVAKLKNRSWFYVPIKNRQRNDRNFFDEKDDAEEPIEEYITISQSNYLHNSLACFYKEGDAHEVRMLSMLKHNNIVFHAQVSEKDPSRIQMEYCIGGSLKDYLSIYDQYGEPRKLNRVVVALMINQIGDALDYMFSNYRMIHGNINEGSILIQTPQILGLPLSFEVLLEKEKRCHENLDNEDINEYTFKLTHFEESKLVSRDIPESVARNCDVVGLANIILSRAPFDSQFLMALERTLTKTRGYTVNAVMNLLRQRDGFA